MTGVLSGLKAPVSAQVPLSPGSRPLMTSVMSISGQPSPSLRRFIYSSTTYVHASSTFLLVRPAPETLVSSVNIPRISSALITLGVSILLKLLD